MSTWPRFGASGSACRDRSEAIGSRIAGKLDEFGGAAGAGGDLGWGHRAMKGTKRVVVACLIESARRWATQDAHLVAGVYPTVI
jgi:hypothetical protein